MPVLMTKLGKQILYVKHLECSASVEVKFYWTHSKTELLAKSNDFALLKFRENYMFDCKCARCEEECDQPSATSSEEDSDSEMST